MSTVFDFSNYKVFLLRQIAEHRGERGYQGRMAAAAGCPPSYLSRVLKSKIELTPDHVIPLAEFLGLGKLESEYLFTLVLHSRAVKPALRLKMGEKLGELKSRHLHLARRLGADESPTGEVESFYFSSWMWAAIHIAVSVPELQTVEALTARFGLSPAKVRQVLARLGQAGLVSSDGERWVYRAGRFHLPSESMMTELNHSHWRQRAILDTQKGNARSLHYTSVFTMRREDALALREQLVKAIEKARGIVGPSEPQEVFCLLADFFEC